MQLKQVQSLIAQLAESAEFIQNFGTIADGVWGIECGDIDIVFTHDAENDRLNLMTALGPVPQNDLVGTYTALLQFNADSLANRGIRRCIDPEGDVLQECDLPLQALEQRLAGTVEHFLNQSREGLSLIGT